LKTVQAAASLVTRVNVARASRNRRVSNAKLALVWVLLLLVTWVTPVGVGLRKAVLADGETGTVVVLFPAGSTTSKNFERIVEAQGAFVRHTWLDQAWIASSYDPGFVGRLKDQGALAVFDTALLDPASLLGCGPPPRRQVIPSD